MKTSWQKNHLENYSIYINEIIKKNTDFLVPVGRKSCKLFSSIDKLFQKGKKRVFYIDYFKYSQIDLKDKSVAIFDDAVNRTSKLWEYRDYFLSQGIPQKHIYTHAFVGHEQLLNNPTKKCDQEANIFSYVSSANYKQYLISQSNYILQSGSSPDINHLILEIEIPQTNGTMAKKLWEYIPKMGYRYHLKTIGDIKRFGLHIENLCDLQDVSKKIGLTIEPDFVQKFRFLFNSNLNVLTLTPICFPKLYTNSSDICTIGDRIQENYDFYLPCLNRARHKIDKYCYLSVCLFLNSLLVTKFLSHIKEQNPNLYSLFRNIKIKQSDIIRFLGENVGNKVISTTKDYIKYNHLNNKERLKVLRNQNDLSFAEIPFYRNNVFKAIKNLRIEYDEAVKKNNDNPINVHVTKSSNYFLNFGRGIHPLILTEVLDEYCDLGVLVPSTKFYPKLGCWRRTYRTGEDPHDLLAWERSKRIVALAIQNLGKSNVKSMYLEKAIANFAFDFPSHLELYSENYKELHCIHPTPSYWGTQNLISLHTDNIKFPLNPVNLESQKLELWNDFSEFFEFNTNPKGFSSEIIITDLPDWFGDHRFIKDYFRFIHELKNKFNRVDPINSLSLCRNKELFNIHIFYNLYKWLTDKAFNGFLKKYRNGNISSKELLFAYQMVASADQKIKCLKLFPKVVQECHTLSTERPDLYGDIWSLIQSNINESDIDYFKNQEITRIIKVINALKAVDGIVRAKLNLIQQHKVSHTLENINKFAQDELDDINIEINVNKLINTDYSHSDLFIIFENIYHGIKTIINKLPKPKKYDEIVKQVSNSHILAFSDKIKFILPEVEAILSKKIRNCIKYSEDELGLTNPSIFYQKNVRNNNNQYVIKIIDDLQNKYAFKINLDDNNPIGNVTKLL